MIIAEQALTGGALPSVFDMQLHTLTLPLGLQWADEWDLSATISSPTKRRRDGGMAIYPRALAAGRPITLVAPDFHPLTRAQANALAALAAVPGASYTLTMPLRPGAPEFLVAFRADGEPPLELRPVIDYPDPEDDDLVAGTIRLMTLT